MFWHKSSVADYMVALQHGGSGGDAAFSLISGCMHVYPSITQKQGLETVGLTAQQLGRCRVHFLTVHVSSLDTKVPAAAWYNILCYTS